MFFTAGSLSSVVPPQRVSGFGKAVSSPRYVADFTPVKKANVWNALEGGLFLTKIQLTLGNWVFLLFWASQMAVAQLLGRVDRILHSLGLQNRRTSTEINVCLGLAISASGETTTPCRCRSGCGGFHVLSMDCAPWVCWSRLIGAFPLLPALSEERWAFTQQGKWLIF